MLRRPYRDAKVEQRVTLAAGDEVEAQAGGRASAAVVALSGGQSENDCSWFRATTSTRTP